MSDLAKHSWIDAMQSVYLSFIWKKKSFGFYRWIISCYDGGTQAVDYAPEGMIMKNLRET